MGLLQLKRLMVSRNTPLNLPFNLGIDANAAAYIAAVEAADGQTLEAGVKTAINSFVIGCKTDGIWNAIKASCILSGARTLSGALIPLTGTAPTNNNFVSGDYNRKTGLASDGVTKNLNSNRNNNADPQNDVHASVYVTVKATGVTGGLMDAGTTPGPTDLYYLGSGSNVGTRSRSITFDDTSGLGGNWLGLFAQSRSSASGYIRRVNSVNTSITRTSAAPDSGNYIVFTTANVRLTFYSIGGSLDLALLDARVTALISAYAAAIP